MRSIEKAKKHFLLTTVCSALLLAQPAHAGLFDAIKSVVPGSSQPAEAAPSENKDAKPSAESKEKKEQNADADAGFFDTKAKPETQLADYVDAAGLEKLKGVKKVLVPQFRVEFQLRSEAGMHASDQSALNHTSAERNVSVYLLLKGIDDAQLQKITDLAYQNFLKEMSAAGIEVVGPDKLATEPEFAAMLKLGKASPAVLETKDGISHFFAPNGGKVYTLLRSTDKDRQGFGSNWSTGFEDTAKEMPTAELALSKKYGAPCMKVLLTMAPGKASISAWAGVGAVAGQGGLIAAQLGAVGDAVTLVNGTAEVLPALTMLEESRIVFRSANHSANDSKMFAGRRFFGSKVRDFTQEGDTAVFLKKPLLIADQISTKKMEDTTGIGSKALNTATTVNKAARVGGLLGFVPFGGALAQVGQVTQVAEVTGNRDHHEYTIEADPKMFEVAANREISAVVRLLLAKTNQAIDGSPSAPAGAK